jgi:glycosyltransferase involved in cell wall biosynthesis
MKISVIIPIFNEKLTIIELLKKVNQEKKRYNIEIIVSDDGSNDGTLELLNKNSTLYDKKTISEKNYGKGHAIKKGIEIATGEITLIQDADLEYDPNNYSKILDPILNNHADIVYGSRFAGSDARRLFYYKNQIANKLLTFLVNILTNINFSDVETGMKVFKTSVLKDLNIISKDFQFEIEVTMKISKINLRIYEVGISYKGRTYAEGKKIKFIDFIMAIYAIFKYKFFYYKK